MEGGAIFRHVISYSPVEIYRRFGEHTADCTKNAVLEVCFVLITFLDCSSTQKI
jgi:hypothetical protein